MFNISVCTGTQESGNKQVAPVFPLCLFDWQKDAVADHILVLTLNLNSIQTQVCVHKLFS